MIFKNYADRTGFNFIGSGLDSDWKISQSAHLWSTGKVLRCEGILPGFSETCLKNTSKSVISKKNLFMSIRAPCDLKKKNLSMSVWAPIFLNQSTLSVISLRCQGSFRFSEIYQILKDFDWIFLSSVAITLVVKLMTTWSGPGLNIECQSFALYSLESFYFSSALFQCLLLFTIKCMYQIRQTLKCVASHHFFNLIYVLWADTKSIVWTHTLWRTQVDKNRQNST